MPLQLAVVQSSCCASSSNTIGGFTVLYRQLSDFVSTKECPTYSPDFSPKDYCIYSEMETKTCSKSHHSADSLKEIPLKAWEEIWVKCVRTLLDAFHVFRGSVSVPVGPQRSYTQNLQFKANPSNNSHGWNKLRNQPCHYPRIESVEGWKLWNSST